MSVYYLDYKSRIKKLQARMGEHGYDALVLSKFGSLCYFTGLVFKDRSAAIIPAQGAEEDIFLVGINIEIGRMRDESWLPNFAAWDFVGSKASGLTYNTSFAETMADCLINLKLDKGKIGIEKDDLVILEYEALEQCLPEAQLENAGSIVDSIQVIKDKAEIELQRRAAEITDVGMQAAFDALRVGATECEIAGAAEFAMRLAGSESHSYGIGGRVGTEIGSGFRSGHLHCWSLPPTQKRIQKGDIVTLDLHCMYQTYISDLSLNAVLGTPSPEQRELAEVWKAGVQTLLQSMKPGVVISDAARATQKVIEDAGWGEYNAPLYGHGLGTTTRIPPTVSLSNKECFQPNMTLNSVLVITKPGLGGMRLELPTLVTENGGEPLAKSPLELMIRET